MVSSEYSKGQLLKLIQALREDLKGFKSAKAQAIKVEIDVLEKRVKKTRGNDKFAFKMDGAQLEGIAAKVHDLQSQRIARGYKIFDWVAIGLGVLMIVLYYIACLTHHAIPQTTVSLLAWFTFGIFAGIIVTLHFMLLFRAHMHIIANHIRFFRNSRSIWMKLDALLWCNHFSFSYLNTIMVPISWTGR